MPRMTPGDHAPAPRTPVPVLLTLLALGVFAAVTSEVLPVGLLPAIGESLHADEASVGLLVSVYAVVVAGASLPLTGLLARWPRRRALWVLLVAYAVGNAVFALADDYAVAVAARLLAGFAHAGFFSVTIGTAVSLVPMERAGRAAAWVYAGTTLALAGGVPAGTALGTAIGWRWSFAAIALVLLTLAALMAVLLPSAPPPATTASEPVLRTLRKRPVLLIAAVISLLTLGHYTAFTYASPILTAAGVGDASVSLVLFGYGNAGALGLWVAGAVADREPRKALLVAVAMTTAALLALGIPGRPVGAVVIAMLVWGAAFGSLPTLLQTLAHRAASTSADTAPAVVNATFNLGISAGGLLGGRVLLMASPSMTAVAGAALTTLALLLVVAAGYRARAGRRPTVQPSRLNRGVASIRGWSSRA